MRASALDAPPAHPHPPPAAAFSPSPTPPPPLDPGEGVAQILLGFAAHAEQRGRHSSRTPLASLSHRPRASAIILRRRSGAAAPLAWRADSPVGGMQWATVLRKPVPEDLCLWGHERAGDFGADSGFLCVGAGI